MSPTENTEHGPVIRDRRRIDPVTGKVRDAEPGMSARNGGAGGRPSGEPSEGRPPGEPSGGDPREPGRPPADRGGSPGGRPPGERQSGKHAMSSPGTEQAPGTAAAGPDDAAAKAAVMLAERTADLQRLQAEYANYRKRVDRDRLAVREQALANVLRALLPVLDDIGRAREHGELTGGFKSVAESLEAITAKLGLTSYGEPGDPFDPVQHDALMHEYSAEVTEPTCVRILQPGYRVGDQTIRPARVAVAEPADDARVPEEPEAAPSDAAADAAESGQAQADESAQTDS